MLGTLRLGMNLSQSGPTCWAPCDLSWISANQAQHAGHLAICHESQPIRPNMLGTLRLVMNLSQSGPTCWAPCDLSWIAVNFLATYDIVMSVGLISRICQPSLFREFISWLILIVGLACFENLSVWMFWELVGLASFENWSVWHVLRIGRSGIFWELVGLACFENWSVWHVLRTGRSGMFWELVGLACFENWSVWHVLRIDRSPLFFEFLGTNAACNKYFIFYHWFITY